MAAAAVTRSDALASTLYYFLLHPDDPLAAIRSTAMSSGDSDSIACIAGALAGAYHGASSLPSTQLDRLEYRPQLNTIISGLADLGDKRKALDYYAQALPISGRLRIAPGRPRPALTLD